MDKGELVEVWEIEENAKKQGWTNTNQCTIKGLLDIIQEN